MICDSCVPGFPNQMDPPNLVPGEDCDEFLEFYEEKNDCCEVESLSRVSRGSFGL